MSTGTRVSALGIGIVLLAGLKETAHAQPFSASLQLLGPTAGFVEIPHSTALNPTDAFTFEAWVRLTDASGSTCSSIAGKNWTQAWWIGICGTTLRSYLKGTSSQVNGGVIPPNQWTHIAVVYDGAHRVHYINGENVMSVAETGPLPASTDPVRFGSDVQFQQTPAGSIDEARIWNVARTQDQIRTGLMRNLTGPTAGVVGLWAFDFSTVDLSGGGHDGAANGTTTYAYAGTGPTCASLASSVQMCLLDRFLVSARFRTGAPGTAESTAQVASAPNPGSGLFWFFSSDNWEVLVKTINGCALNDNFWAFSAATTNVFYRLEVRDFPTGAQRIYFNYPGPPAPAVTDTTAFATCPSVS